MPGTPAISLAAAITKLAQAPTSGGTNVVFDADASGSAHVVINPEGEVSFSISDAAGRNVISGQLDPDDGSLITWNCVAYTYDNAGRKATESLTMGGQTYSIGTDYELTGQVSRLTYPDGTEVDRTYSERGQLATIAFNGTTIDTRTYDDGGRMLTSSYNNGVSESRTYNIDNTLASINFAGAQIENPIGNLNYGWDANKNKTTETIAGTMSGCGFDATTYDHEDRLVSWNRADNALDQSWNLSLVGDWNSVTENTSVQVRTHGPTHELLTAAGAAVQHDAKGNQTLIPPALRPTPSGLTPTASRLRWDFENKLIAADTNDDGTDDVFYKWDALGRRVGRIAGSSSTVYVQDGQQTIADYTLGTAATTPTYNYLYASYIDEPVMRTGSGNSIYFHRNQQYSITALTNGSGTVVERYAYSAYGTPTIAGNNGSQLATSAFNNRYTYTGREYDEAIFLYHYRARMYDSVAGRFCSRDPIGYVDGMSLYRGYFVPDTVDPFGLDSPLGPAGGGGGVTATQLLNQLCKASLKGPKPAPVTTTTTVTAGACVTKFCTLIFATQYASSGNNAILNAAAADLAGRVNRGEITEAQAVRILRQVRSTNQIGRDCRAVKQKMRETPRPNSVRYKNCLTVHGYFYLNPPKPSVKLARQLRM